MSIKLFGKSQILKKDECLTVYREGTNIPVNVDYIDGKPIKRNTITFYIKANVQPLTDRELLLVPEGDRFREQYYIFVENKVVITEEGLEIQAENLVKDNDQIIRLGHYFQAQGTANWGSYTRARIMKVDVGPNRSKA